MVMMKATGNETHYTSYKKFKEGN